MASGLGIAGVCQQLEVSEATFHRWRHHTAVQNNLTGVFWTDSALTFSDQ